MEEKQVFEVWINQTGQIIQVPSMTETMKIHVPKEWKKIKLTRVDVVKRYKENLEMVLGDIITKAKCLENYNPTHESELKQIIKHLYEFLERIDTRFKKLEESDGK